MFCCTVTNKENTMLEHDVQTSLRLSKLDERSISTLQDHCVHLASILSRLGRCILYALVPQLIRTKYFRDPLPATKVNSTSWMNGLRGLAALVVFNFHYWYVWSHLIFHGFQLVPGQRYFFQLPPFPLIFDGSNSVQIFWVVAGYTCSYKALDAMTKGDRAVLGNLSASIFRRFFRLYLAPIISMLCIALLAYVGAFELSIPLYQKNSTTHNEYFTGPVKEPHPRRFPSLQSQLAEWMKQVHGMGNIWVEHSNGPLLDWHLWTIICEFRGSMHLFISLIALANCRPYIRLSWLALLGYVYVVQWSHHECLPFFYGAIVAQLNILRKVKGDELLKRSPQVRGCLRGIAYILGVYLCCYPMNGYRHPTSLYGWINAWIPATYGRLHAFKFPKQLGSLILLYLLDTTPVKAQSLLHRLLTSSFATYLGSIMFGLYLVHGCVLHLIGYVVPCLVWSVIGNDDHGFRHFSGLWIGYIVSLILCLWVADVWTREIEGRINRAIKWLENMCFEPEV